MSKLGKWEMRLDRQVGGQVMLDPPAMSEVPSQRCYDNNSGEKKMDFSVSGAETTGLSN